MLFFHYGLFFSGQFSFDKVWMDMKWNVELNAMMTPQGAEVPFIGSLWYRGQQRLGDDKTCVKLRCDPMGNGKKIYSITNSVSTYTHRPLCMKF